MSDNSARLALPFIQPSQAQKHVTHNEALLRLDLLVQLAVEAFDADTPPSLPQEGQIWALGPAPGGDWAGQADMLAARVQDGWEFISPQPGWRAAQGNDLRVWTGDGWTSPALPELTDLPGLGVNTGFDSTNRLAVSAPATLLSHAGADHRLKINRAAASDTASLLFQTGWSGRAELGMAGGDDLAIKVSADGSFWHEAAVFERTSGRARLRGGAHLPDGTEAAPALAFEGDPDSGIWRIGEDQIGLATGGVARLRANTSGVEVTGTLTGSAVTQAADDTTAGRLLKTGDAGWMANGISGATAVNAATVSGAYSYAGQAIDPQAPTGGGGTLLVMRHGGPGGFIVQLAHVANSWRLFDRYSTDGGASWSAWSMAYGRRNVLGAVGQTGGVPTGGLIERGSNANGDYVRLADGTQICTREFSVADQPIDKNFMGGFRDSGSTVPWAASFAATPSTDIAVTGVSAFGTVLGNVTTTACSLFFTAISSQGAATRTARVTATGRWF